MTHGHGNIGNIDRPDLVGKDYSVVSEEIGKAERLQLFRIIVRGGLGLLLQFGKNTPEENHVPA